MNLETFFLKPEKLKSSSEAAPPLLHHLRVSVAGWFAMMRLHLLLVSKTAECK